MPLGNGRPGVRVLVLAVAAGTLLVAAGVKWRAGAAPPGERVELAIRSARAEPAAVLAGQPVRLTAEVAAADQLEWSVNRLIVARSARATWVAPGRPGLYRVRLLATGGGGKRTAEVLVQVRVPSPTAGPLAAAPTQEWPTALASALDDRLAELRLVAGRRDTRYEQIDARDALAQIASLLSGAERYEEAIKAYTELLAMTSSADPRATRYRGALGEASYLLGRDEEALVALQRARAGATAMQSYYLGQILERRGDLDGAIVAYQRAWRGGRGFTDPGFRVALLRSRRGDPDDEIEAALIAMAMGRLGVGGVIDGLGADPEMAGLGALLERRGGAAAFEQRVLAAVPPAPPPPAPRPPPPPPGQTTTVGESP